MQYYNNRTMMNMPAQAGPLRLNTVGINGLPDRYYTNARTRALAGNQIQFGPGFVGFANTPAPLTGGFARFPAGMNPTSGGCGCRRGF